MMSPSIERQSTLCRAFLHWLRVCLQRHQTRQSLRQLSDTQLTDIGLSRVQAVREGCKPFWRK